MNITHLHRHSTRLRPAITALRTAQRAQRFSTHSLFRQAAASSSHGSPNPRSLDNSGGFSSRPKSVPTPAVDFSKYPAVKPNPHIEKSRMPPPQPYNAKAAHNKAKDVATVDPVIVHKRIRNQVLGGLGLFIGTMIIYQIFVQPLLNQATPESEKQFQDVRNKQAIIVKETTVGGELVDTVESGTSHVGPLPTRIFLPTTTTAGVSDISGAQANSSILEEYSLVGHGIRTVSFLSVQVYVVALYVATSSLPNLQNALLDTLDIPSSATTATLPERDTLRGKMMDEKTGVEVVNKLLDLKSNAGIKMAIRIVPTRNTDFPHLRDGWVRGITAQTKTTPDLYDDDEFVNALGHFKTLFGGKGSVAKGGVMLLARDEKGSLVAYGPDESKKDVVPLAEGGKKHTAMDGLKLLGKVDDERVSRALWLCYWAGKKVASEGARKSVVEGMVDIVARPVGSTEGKVV